MVEQLKKYFKQTPYQDIVKDWENVVEECSNIDSPLVSEFIEQSFSYHFKIPEWYVQSKQSSKEENINPSSNSDFFIFVC